MIAAPEPRTYVLKPRPPVRAFVIAAALTLVGALLVSIAQSADASLLWVVLASIILIAGLALAGMAAWSMVTMRTFIDLASDGYRIHGPGVDKSGGWEDVTKVTTSAQGSHLTLYHGEVGRTHVICPGGGEDPEMVALVEAVAKHLDANRGYGETINVPLIDPHQPPNPDVVQHQQ
ncbi:hypothetical protein [Luteococcus sp. OSA5]|uniref:hypothetical protein n=1 Tax=Luteococcus sp. OSA5 TaxID=3401630 RepID=UPI003B43A569